MDQKEELSKERILQAAEEEFLKKGFQKASLRNIAKIAGVTTGSLYWHFKNIEELQSLYISICKIFNGNVVKEIMNYRIIFFPHG